MSPPAYYTLEHSPSLPWQGVESEGQLSAELDIGSSGEPGSVSISLNPLEHLEFFIFTPVSPVAK